MYAAHLIADGFVGEPYLINCFEQNSQWLDPATPLRQTRDGDPDMIAVSSVEGYGAPVIDIMHWWLNAPLTRSRKDDGMTPSSQDGPPLRHRSLPESVHEILRARILNNEIPAGARRCWRSRSPRSSA